MFVNFSPFFKLYAEYIVNFEQSREKIALLREKNSSFVRFIKAAERVADPQGKQPFESYLITPVQRIPRYKMLLSELLKYTPEEHLDRANIQVSGTDNEQISDHNIHMYIYIYRERERKTCVNVCVYTITCYYFTLSSRDGKRDKR